MTRTLTRAHLSEALHNKMGLSRTESTQLVDSVLNHISESLVNGEDVQLSSFGRFSLRDKGQRVGRNPKTGEEVPITPRRVISFRPSTIIKDQITRGGVS